MKYEKPEISQKVQLQGALGMPPKPKPHRGSMIDYVPVMR